MTSRARFATPAVVLALVAACASTTEPGGTSPSLAAPSTAVATAEERREAWLTSQELSKAVMLYWFAYSDYPTQEQGLSALIETPDGKPVLEELPRDPWGRAFGYLRPGKLDHDFGVYSRGPDGEAGTDDDIGSWQPRPADQPLADDDVIHL